MSAKPKWTPIKKALGAVDKPELIELIHGLFELSDANRTYLAARFDPLAGVGMKYKYLDKIQGEFFTKRGYGRARPSVVRKAIGEYRRSTGDIPGTLDLMVTYVEEATTFMNAVGGIEELIDSVVTVGREIIVLFQGLEEWVGSDDLLERLTIARDEAQGIGWGYGDFLDDVVDKLKSRG